MEEGMGSREWEDEEEGKERNHFSIQ